MAHIGRQWLSGYPAGEPIRIPHFESGSPLCSILKQPVDARAADAQRSCNSVCVHTIGKSESGRIAAGGGKVNPWDSDTSGASGTADKSRAASEERSRPCLLDTVPPAFAPVTRGRRRLGSVVFHPVRLERVPRITTDNAGAPGCFRQGHSPGLQTEHRGKRAERIAWEGSTTRGVRAGRACRACEAGEPLSHVAAQSRCRGSTGPPGCPRITALWSASKASLMTQDRPCP